MNDARDVQFSCQEGKLRGYMFKPEDYRNGVVICHGFPGNSSRFFIPGMARELGSRYLTLAFDFSGNGRSDGRFYDTCISHNLEDLEKAVKYVLSFGVDSVCLIGHSTGGAVVTLYAPENKNGGGLITIATQADLEKAMHEDFSCSQLKKLRTNGKAMIHNPSSGKDEFVSRRFIDDYTKFKPLEVAKEIQVPVLIIYGTADDTADPSHSKLLYEKIPGSLSAKKELYAVEGADHVFSQHSGELIKKCKEWAEMNLN